VSLPTTIADAAEALGAGRIGAVELTRASLDRAAAAQAALGCFIHVAGEAALASARRADADRARGREGGPLRGVPLGVKDILATVDAPTTASSRSLDPAWGAGRDATAVGKLRAAGAVLVGKLSLHELATGWPTVSPVGVDPATGLPFARNPWDTARAPGGSSSGTGAALAAGLVLGGLGTDTTGSIRHPAAYCGITGLKPTYGRVSRAGCLPLAWGFDHVGPMARGARDCALLLQAIAGHDPADPSGADHPVPDYTAGLDGSLRGLRLGVLRADFLDVPELRDDARAAVLAAVAAMAAAGASAVDVALPHAVAGRAASWIASRVEAHAYHEATLRRRPEAYGRGARRVLHVGALYGAADYLQAQRVRALVRAEVADAFAGADVLVAPTMTGVAPPFAGYDPDAAIVAPSFTALWNLAGNPAISLPGGFSTEGLPIGLQLIGRPFDEATLLRVADAYQRLTDWHLRRPPEPFVAERLAEPGPEPPAESGPSADAVDAAARLGGLALDPTDRARLIRLHPHMRAMAESLRVPELPALEPSPLFRAG
jgi:aspartyl-tRNA(Asn)/glutamyl-tRNA(Gln) amidotransferase subunit A